VTIPAGGTLTWRFQGPHPPQHHAGERSARLLLSQPVAGREFRKKLSVPGTYQLFCGLHPVDMTATIKVKGRKKGSFTLFP
jgi:plastocyanin